MPRLAPWGRARVPSAEVREVVADLDAFFEQARGTTPPQPWSGARVYRPAVRRNVKLAEAPSFGKTIFEYDKWCPGGLDYRALAETIAHEWDVARGVIAPAGAATPSAAPPSRAFEAASAAAARLATCSSIMRTNFL